MNNPTAGTPLKLALFVVFTGSGFSGLIYESIWSHYLKLMLGHAAYAQTLVLAIFMGGMAVGAWLASRYSKLLTKPLLAYAAAELAVGFMALGFHALFTAALDGLYLRWLPDLTSPMAAEALKWSVGALLILPQSILLGTTFPLMGAGFIRLFPATPGAGLGLLYFANSLGAAVGALFSVFVLIPIMGLPGTVLTAGLINAFLAIAVWAMVKEIVSAPVPETPAPTAHIGLPLLKPLLAIALCSSLASFLYEIGWIRMLSLVLGSSVQAFELMLSAFIFGLAFGGLWIRRRLDRIENPLRYAGHVQILMGVCALATLPLYLSTFDFMAFLIQSLVKNEGGWKLFNIGSHFIAMAVMLPATFTAGMTLPLFTYILLRQGEGEKSIGRIYSANTVGAIVGVLLAVHWLMPWVGVKGLVGGGALLDMLVGFFLLALSRPQLWRWELPLGAGVASAVFLAAMLGIRFDPLVLSSGVYRNGISRLLSTESIFYRDGKTASVALNKYLGLTIVQTNGKPDASIQMEGGQHSLDEITQALSAVLPLALHPQAKSIAAIGFGSGMTTHTVLGARSVERMDTIEIEQSMVDAGHAFGPWVERAYQDPRSHIHIDDAKTYFSSHNARYDVIISEPSNPWVSGVASLFTDEFYRHITHHLQPDGVLVQWIQLYETNLPLLSSVFKALSRHFDHYVVFNTGNEDILIMASNGRDLNKLDGWILGEPALQTSLARLGIKSLEDLSVRRIADQSLLQPFFSAFATPVNSDYFPYLSHNAPKARYLKEDAASLSLLHYYPVPILEMLDRPRMGGGFVAAPVSLTEIPAQERPAGRIVHALLSPEDPDLEPLEGDAFLVQFLRHELLGKTAPPLADEMIRASLLEAAMKINPFLPASKVSPVWDLFIRQPSYSLLSPLTQNWLALFRAVSLRDGQAMGESASQVIKASPKGTLSEKRVEYLLTAGLTGYLAAGDFNKAQGVIDLYAQTHHPLAKMPPTLSILVHLLASRHPATAAAAH